MRAARAALVLLDDSEDSGLATPFAQGAQAITETVVGRAAAAHEAALVLRDAASGLEAEPQLERIEAARAAIRAALTAAQQADNAVLALRCAVAALKAARKL